MTGIKRDSPSELRKADRLRKLREAENRAQRRAAYRTYLGSSLAPRQLDLLESVLEFAEYQIFKSEETENHILKAVLQYAEDRMDEHAHAEADGIWLDLAPLTVEMVNTPVVREMVRLYAEALTRAYHFPTFGLPTPSPTPCSQCGAPHLDVMLEISERD